MPIEFCARLLCAFCILFITNHTAYYLMLIGLGIASALTTSDDIGLVDLAALALSLIPFVLLIKDRQWYLQTRQGAANG